MLIFICFLQKQALEEVEKNVVAVKQALSGDGEVEPNPDNVSQIAVEICKEDVLGLFIHKLSILGWEVRNKTVLSHMFPVSSVFNLHNYVYFRQEKI